MIFLKMDANKVLGMLDNHDASMRRGIAQWQSVAGPLVIREIQRFAPIKKGVLRNSIQAEISGSVVKVGSRLPYAKYQNEGTRPYTITPLHAKVLKFQVGGRTVFTKEVHHPGLKPKKFLEKGLNSRKDFLIALLKQYVLQEHQYLD